MIHCENSECKNYFEDGCVKNLNNEMISLDNTGKCFSFEKGRNKAYKDLDKDEVYVLSKEEAIAMLPDKEFIHTYRNSNIALLGADWKREEIVKAMDQYQFELTGEQATSMGHGMAFADDFGWVFVETK